MVHSGSRPRPSLWLVGLLVSLRDILCLGMCTLCKTIACLVIEGMRTSHNPGGASFDGKDKVRSLLLAWWLELGLERDGDEGNWA